MDDGKGHDDRKREIRVDFSTPANLINGVLCAFACVVTLGMIRPAKDASESTWLGFCVGITAGIATAVWALANWIAPLPPPPLPVFPLPPWLR